MIKYYDECVDCPPEMGCVGRACRYRNIPHYFCDQCGEEFMADDLLTDDDGETMLCEDCILSRYKRVGD